MVLNGTFDRKARSYCAPSQTTDPLHNDTRRMELEFLTEQTAASHIHHGARKYLGTSHRRSQRRIAQNIK